MREKICQDIFNGLLFDDFLFLLLLLNDILGFSELHFGVLISLLEGSLAIRVIGVWILPELPDEVAPLAKIVISDELVFEEDWIDFMAQRLVSIVNFVVEVF